MRTARPRLPERRAAAEALLRDTDLTVTEIAARAGVSRRSVGRWNARAPRRPPPDDPAGAAEGVARAGRLEAVADAASLRLSLRAHIARQIAAFDAALRGEGAAVLESARVLRDLGGLKRLLDELAAEDRAAPEGDDGGEPDLPALRAEIARRYARFVGGRDDP